MVTKSLEERLDYLEEKDNIREKRLNELEHEIERLQAVNEIQNLMCRYQYMHMAGLHDDKVELYAQKTPGVSTEVTRGGVYEGFERIRNLYVRRRQASDEGSRLGTMTMHTLTTSLIEVAGDGKTAQGIWVSPGIVTTASGGKGQAGWRWTRFGADFVKEDGKWKFWHLRVYGIFFTPYDKPWTEQAFPQALRLFLTKGNQTK